MGASVAFGWISFRGRRSKIGAEGLEYAVRETEMSMNILNDAMMGLIGYFCGHFVACDYIYKHRQYVLQRVYLEQTRQIFPRTNLLREPGVMLNEYPIRDPEIMLDSEIIYERMNPSESEENTRNLRAKVENWDQRYQEKKAKENNPVQHPSFLEEKK